MKNNTIHRLNLLAVILGMASVTGVSLSASELSSREPGGQSAGFQKATAYEMARADDDQAQLYLVSIFDAQVSYLEQDDGSLRITLFAGRVRNNSQKRLSALTVKIRIFDANRTQIDTRTFDLYVGAGPGDVMRSQVGLGLYGVPKGFTWSFEIVRGNFY